MGVPVILAQRASFEVVLFDFKPGRGEFEVAGKLYFARPKVRHLNVATFRQNVGLFRFRPALWRVAATSHIRPCEV